MKWKAGLVCGIIAFVLVIVGFVGGWFTMNMEGGLMPKTDVDYKLTEATATVEGISVTRAYADMPEEYGGSDMISVFNNTMILVLLALVFTLLLFVFAILVGKGKIGNKAGVAIGALAIVFTLIPFVYFMATLPPTFPEGMEGFWGSLSLAGTETSWGPGFAWYLMIVAFVFALIGTVMLMGAAPVEEIVPVEPPVGEPLPPPEPPMEEIPPEPPMEEPPVE